MAYRGKAADLALRVAGVDYGLKGAVAVLAVEDEASPKRELRGVPVRRIVSVTDLYARGHLSIAAQVGRGDAVYVEDFMLRFATKSQREACIRYGRVLEALLHAGCCTTRVRPEVWKRALGLSPKSSYEARKREALKLARRLWPAFTFKRSDHAEAALIAEYGWRVLNA